MRTVTVVQAKVGFPFDPMTLQRAPRVTPVNNLRNGMYIHLGLEECLQIVLESTVTPAHGIIEFHIYVSGL